MMKKEEEHEKLEEEVVSLRDEVNDLNTKLMRLKVL